MPLNKGYQRRIEIIDACLRRRQRNWTIEAILDEVNDKLEGMGLARISQRSLYNNIKAMRMEYDAPIETFKTGTYPCHSYVKPNSFICEILSNLEHRHNLNIDTPLFYLEPQNHTIIVPRTFYFASQVQFLKNIRKYSSINDHYELEEIEDDHKLLETFINVKERFVAMIYDGR